MATTPNSALRYPASSDSPAGWTQIQNLATDLDKKVLPAFASISARNTAIPSPTQGQPCTVNGDVHVYDGSGWRWHRYGVVNTTTDTSALVAFSHGGGATPLYWGCTLMDQATDALNVSMGVIAFAMTSTTLTARGVRLDTNTYAISTTIKFSWWARF